MRQKKPVVAICYDFDGTLSPGNMQEYGFLPGLSESDRKHFWDKSEALAKKQGADQILAYMRFMLQKAEESKGDANSPVKTTRKAMKDYGKKIELFPGVLSWFSRIKTVAEDAGVSVEHYIISSGLKEMIEGSPIAKKFKKIYACSYMYDNNDVAEWPAQVVNCTSKTQYLFRINKGAHDLSDTKRLNSYIPPNERQIPFPQMIYIGDGSTDIPCMKVVKAHGGHSIAVYDPSKRAKKTEAIRLRKQERVNFCVPADYQEGSQLESIVSAIITKIAADYRLKHLPKRSGSRTVESADSDVTIDSESTISKGPLELSKDTATDE